MSHLVSRRRAVGTLLRDAAMIGLVVPLGGALLGTGIVALGFQIADWVAR